MRALIGTLIAALWLAGTAQAENIIGDKAVLRALDKISAETKDFTVNVGDTLHFGSLDIEVKHCEKRPPEEIPETYVFLQIFEKPLGSNTEAGVTNVAADIRSKNDRSTEVESMDPRGDKLFSGWMLASNPAVSALDHRVYDVWVLDCKSS